MNAHVRRREPGPRGIRSWAAIRAAAYVLAWFPWTERPWVKESLRRDLGLNAAEMNEVNKGAFLIEDDLEYTEDELGLFLDTIDCARVLSRYPADREGRIAAGMIEVFGLTPGFYSEACRIAAFLRKWPLKEMPPPVDASGG